MADVDGLYALAVAAEGGLSSLQPDREFLSRYIACSEDSFAGAMGRGEPDKTRKFLLVMETLGDEREIIGCAAVKTNIGAAGEPPFINFDLSPDGQLLSASDRFAGATEVGSLYLRRDHRAGGLGTYLARVRYLMIAARPEAFSRTVIAELRGVSRDGQAPFYDSVFAAKFGVSFLEADARFASLEDEIMEKISPEAPVNVSDLSASARAAMGQPHRSGLSALAMLHAEGFADSRTVDLFDGGPIVAAARDKITTLRNSRLGHGEVGEVSDDAALHLICAGNLGDFRAVLTRAQVSRRDIVMPERAANALAISPGQSVRYWAQGQSASKRQVSTESAHV